MPLNYSKWDALELSDDSDVEVHPNIDKKSWIRFQQRNIHEKRQERRSKISTLQMELEMNAVILSRIDDILCQLDKEGVGFLEREASRLAGSADQTKPVGSTGPSYDEMMASLLQQVAQEVREKRISESKRSEALKRAITHHRVQLVARTEECKREIDREEFESKKKITSEDIHEGFSSGHVAKDASSKQPIEKSRPATFSSTKGKAKATEIEVLNPKTVPNAESTLKSSAQQDGDPGNDSDDEVPDLSSEARAFARIPAKNWQQLFAAISQSPSLLTEKTTDALLVEAFNAAMKGDELYCYQCVHQGLIIQYCGKLGRDGTALFFKRMEAGPPRKVFEDDVAATFQRLSQRAKTVASEQQETPQGEAIQLYATEEGTEINFDVPDGPPPEHLVLEGEGTEELDIEDVRAYLQSRWDIFESFPPNLQKALKTNELDAVNKVLAAMAIDQAEEVVGQLDEARILRFGSRDIRDDTRQEM